MRKLFFAVGIAVFLGLIGFVHGDVFAGNYCAGVWSCTYGGYANQSCKVTSSGCSPDPALTPSCAGGAVTNNCYFVTCGGFNQSCCTGSWCESNLSCNGSNVCDCGHLGEKCCGG